LQDVLLLQDEVARDIADEIRLELTPQERARLGSAHKVNPEAHEAYLEGRYYWDQFTVPTTRKSLGFFQQAIEKDPNYALGYSGLAHYYGVMYIRFGVIPRAEACPKAEAAARKAIELDDSLSEPHISLGAIRVWCDWDLQSGESELKQAIQLSPSNSEAHRVYAVTLTLKGRGEEATAEMARAVENDPMSPEINQMLGWVYYVTRRYDRAARQYRKAAEMDPKRADPVSGLGNVYAKEGHFDLAIREYRKAIELAGGRPVSSMLSPLGYAYARAGKRRQALEILARMDRMPGVMAMDRVAVYIGLGDKQHALAWLEKAYENHELGMLELKSDPDYDPLRSDPRFQALVRRVGL
jgi:tetratricopeptide (TPR) repeat protein